MSRTLLRSVPFRQRLKQSPVDAKILAKIRKLKIGWTKDNAFKGDRKGDISVRRAQLDAVKFKPTLKFSTQDISKLRATATATEVAFGGRSNVGKSSLLNALINRPHGLAQVSNKPGQTQALNFYEIYSPTLRRKPTLLDMPGYGFSFAKAKDTLGWPQLSQQYICDRPNLQRLVLLVDARHGLKQSDQEFLRILASQSVSTALVLTKADLLAQTQLAKMIWLVQQELKVFGFPHNQLTVDAVSAKTLAGVSELRDFLFEPYT